MPPVALRQANWKCRLLLAMLVIGCPRGAVVADETMRLRIAWGGGAERLWKGRIALSDGFLSQPRLLGIEADEPGSMWIQPGNPEITPLRGTDGPTSDRPRTAGQYLAIWQRSPRTYDGVDLLLSTSNDATLYIELVASDDERHPGWIAVPVADLESEFFSSDLDDRGNRLLIQRTPDDTLRVGFSRRSLVFEPGESFAFELQPNRLPVESGSKVGLNIELLEGRSSNVLWSTKQQIMAGQETSLPQEVTLPDREGVYDIRITATNVPSLGSRVQVRSSLSWNQTIATRNIQVLVLDGRQATLPGDKATAWKTVVEIDPANPRWWERFAKIPQLPRLKRLWSAPLGSGHTQAGEHPLGQLVELRASEEADEMAWEAYTLPIDRPGRPHLLEVDYPSDVSQTLGISIVEPNTAGAIAPIGLDSGVESIDDILESSPEKRWHRHRVIFWPKTKAPMVLITNQRDRSAAVYGKIRVLAGPERLPRAPSAAPPQAGRLLAGYLDRPLFPENFSATEAVGTLSHRGVDDWVTFHEGGTRLVDYLNHVGQNGLMISALADGSSIYPSRLLEPTPRYDSGVFLDAGQDPVRKDVLEMLFRLFDREELQLIPALEFGSPLPELEAVLRRGGPEAEGIQWIGADGKSWLASNLPRRGMAPYYNVLHPRVQEAMLAVVRELVESYAHHRSFAGLGIHLSAYGYAQLPGPRWGLDEVTLTQFQRDTNVRLPAAGPDRVNALLSLHLDEWLAWRADRLSRFHHRIHTLVTTARADGRLYLAGADMLASEELRLALKPRLPRQMTLADAMLQVGVDAKRYAQPSGIVLLRPERISPSWSLAREATDLEIRQMSDTDSYFGTAGVRGSLFFHQSREIRLASFDAQSPFQPSYTWLASQVVPSGMRNRQRFIHSLATLDSQVMFDGGWQLPMGQEDSLRDLIAAYRRLPAVPFETVSGSSSQPVTIRQATHEGVTYAYLVNDAPFAMTVQVHVAVPPGVRPEELSGSRQLEPLQRTADGARWSVRLEPYELIGVRFGAPGVRLYGAHVPVPPRVEETLDTRIGELQDRTAALRNPPILQVLDNPGFELPKTVDGLIPGWEYSTGAGVSIRSDSNLPHGGTGSIRISSHGPEASLVSQAFEAPTTGRLTAGVWLRLPENGPRPPLHMALIGCYDNGEIRCFARRNLTLPPAAGDRRPGTDWQYVDLTATDLPLEGLDQLKVRFDLAGAGDVWIDDVVLCELLFTQGEWTELLKLISPAEGMLREGQVSDCIKLLEGYWPRFLVANVPRIDRPVSRRHDPPEISASKSPETTEPSIGFLDRMKGYVPKNLSFF